ncbi:MAG: ribosome maturation factor RimM [Gemmatimonadota bacterium]|nr:MAG: ribosome maturation factor RimM [Gemmatimonadota bacterium]
MVADRRGADAPAADLLVVAELGPPHGIRGEIMGRLVGVEPEVLRNLEPLWLRLEGSETIPVQVVSIRPKKKSWILAIGLADRTEAERHRGAELVARRSDLPEPDPGEWYVADLVGLSVITEGGEELGNLDEVLQLPANDVAVVTGARGEVLVPLLEHVVMDVDQEARRMTVRLPVGLLDEA